MLVSNQYGSQIALILTQKQAKSLFEQNIQSNRIYPVLVKNEIQAKTKKDEIRALSEHNSGGRGGISSRHGFHSLTKDDSLSIANQTKPKQDRQISQSTPSPDRPTLQTDLAGIIWQKELTKSNKTRTSPRQGQRKNKEFRIPSNYRFRQDFLLRFDGSSLLSIASQKLVGFAYFRSMIAQIRENFAPPGLNYIFRDYAGYVINEPIKPQIVQVIFALDPEGNVSDVRKLSSIGQKLVDEACINTLSGRNFGKPPKEIFQKGNVFGIHFVFPALRR